MCNMEMIKKALLVTFDFTQRGKTGTGLAAACLISACRHHHDYGNKFTISHLPIVMPAKNEKKLSAENIMTHIHKVIRLEQLDRLVLSCYIWSSKFIEPIIKLCKANGFKGKVILGGYQIHADTCRALYPSGDYYILGYAEKSLPEAILDDTAITHRIIDTPVDLQSLPSPYLDGTLPITNGIEMIHWESRRGCAFKCNFCAHRDLIHKRVKLFGIEKVKSELDLFKLKNVKKINVLDPIFNLEDNHLSIMEYAIKIELKSLLSFQVRFENIKEDFLKLCAQLNVHLEFGLQTTHKDESIIIERGNNMRRVDKTITLLHKYKQSFEVSLIYGLPGQTLESFKSSIDYLNKRNVKVIKAFPLMLLEGTKLAKDKGKFNIIEDIIDESNIPHVVACYSFSNDEWKKMHQYANKLTAQ
jgi:radical SAM superfamily enzyme YgiQ (UPF0313 family)